MNNIERKDVRIKMLKLFRSYKQLEIFLMDEFDVPCNQFGDQSKNLEEVVFDLIETSNATGMLQPLVERLMEKYPVDFCWLSSSKDTSRQKRYASESVRQEGGKNVYIEQAGDMNITM